MEKKNLIIAALAGLVILGSLWGSVGNKNSKMLRHELEQAEEQLATVEAASSQTHDAVLTKTADLQKSLQVKDNLLSKARKELVELRKANKGLEAKLSARDAAVQKLTAENGQITDLQQKVTVLQKALKEKETQLAAKMQDNSAEKQLAEMQGKVTALEDELARKDEQVAQLEATQKQALEQAEELAQEQAEELAQEQAEAQETEQATEEEIAVAQEDMAAAEEVSSRELETAKAQIIGLEKILEEKNAVIEEISHQLDKVKLNMDVLLARIGNQQDELQEVQEENRELVKELTVKNEELADLQEQLQVAPIQE